MTLRPGKNPRALLNYTRWHYRRPVDWRWRRARRLVRDGKWPIAKADDPWTIEAYRYADARRSLFGKCYFTDRMIDIHAARKLSRVDSPVRWELEARVLAREQLASVAAKTGVAADTICAYEAVFFHVWPKIDVRDYIHGMVIGSRRPWMPTRVRDLWCHLAYTGGPFVLDTIIEHFKQAGEPDYSYLMKPLGPQRGNSDLEQSINRLLRLMLLETSDNNREALAEMASAMAATEKVLAIPLADDLFAASLDQAIDASLGAIPTLNETRTAVLDQSGAA